MARPTEAAKFKFDKASRFANQAGGHYMTSRGVGKASDMEKDDRLLTAAVRELADGLVHLSDGLRATYILLEEVKNARQ
jgi:hypothetical protein